MSTWEVVRVRQLVEKVVEGYSQVIQVSERSSVIGMSDFYFESLANSLEKLNSLHQDATDKIQGFRTR